MSCQTSHNKCIKGDESKHFIKFANSYYDEFRRMRFGVKSCKKPSEVWLDELRHEILQYQKVDDTDALCQVNIIGTLIPSLSLIFDPMNKCNVHVKFTNGSQSESIVQINTGGCITYLNIDPIVNVGTSFEYTQDCATPSDEWFITHNLDLVPNVWVEDCSGNDIIPTIEVVDNNTIKLKFSQPVSGKAFLS